VLALPARPARPAHPVCALSTELQRHSGRSAGSGMQGARPAPPRALAMVSDVVAQNMSGAGGTPNSACMCRGCQRWPLAWTTRAPGTSPPFALQHARLPPWSRFMRSAAHCLGPRVNPAPGATGSLCGRAASVLCNARGPCMALRALCAREGRSVMCACGCLRWLASAGLSALHAPVAWLPSWRAPHTMADLCKRLH